MVTWFYLIALLIAVIMTGTILVKNKKVDNAFVLFCVLLTINCAGRYWMAISQTVETAILANKILYVGACYLPCVIFWVVTRLCSIKVNRYFNYFLLGYATVVMFFVLTIGHNDWYYVSVNLVRKNGFTRLIKEYGTFHFLYPVMMVMYSIMLISFVFFAIKKRREISTRTVVIMSCLCSAVFLTYLFEKLIDSEVSYLSIGYIIGMVLLMGYYDRINMYDMSANIVSSVDQMKEYGYIVLDKKCRYVSANMYIKEIFPEIEQWVVDKVVPESDSHLYRKVIRGLLDENDEIRTNRTIEANDRYFHVDVRELSYGRKKHIGYLIAFVDRTAEKKYYNAIEEYNTKLEQEVDEKTEHIVHMKDMLVLGMAEMVESRDANTGGHIKRTSEVVRIFAEKLMSCEEKFGFTKEFLKLVTKAAPMHDLGKIAIDDAVLRKPGKYTEEEYAEMKRHSVEGARIVKNILDGVEDEAFVRVAKNVAFFHHEKWNGQGYPLGKKGEEIPPEARIMALADVFDALVSKRCYKEAFSYDEAFSIMEESLGQQFDPELGKVFMECRRELEAFYDENK
ncbi:MAG: HD domain-containing protein [Lachnospiraceae bacterium]|nr:HD domain-containing protein [Lachnospiraceae bacterium]